MRYHYILSRCIRLRRILEIVLHSSLRFVREQKKNY